MKKKNDRNIDLYLIAALEKVETRNKQMMTTKLIIIYLMLVYSIQMVETLKCYSCRGGQDCGPNFSAKSSNIKHVESKANESLSSCSITVTPEGLTMRDVLPAYLCRSSSSQYCCNEDFCNSLPSPPLPALTSLKCAIGTCTMSNGICITDAAYVTVLSSATESCSIIFENKIKKYYKKACQPTVNDASRGRAQALSKPPVFCCNSPECNRDLVTSGVQDPAIQCYTCDSRITGPAGCTIFNESSPYVYKAGSSSHNEACATITGLAGKDSATGKRYPAFTIRTFVPKCVSKSLGTVSYGGATFRGRIDCCSRDFCNTRGFNETKRNFRVKKLIKMGGIAGGITAVLLLIISIVVVIINRSRKNKNNTKYDPCATNEVQTQLKTLRNKHFQLNTDPYPEPTAAP